MLIEDNRISHMHTHNAYRGKVIGSVMEEKLTFGNKGKIIIHCLTLSLTVLSFDDPNKEGL